MLVSKLTRMLYFSARYIRRDGLKTAIGKEQTADLLETAALKIEELYHIIITLRPEYAEAEAKEKVQKEKLEGLQKAPSSSSKGPKEGRD